MDIELAVDVLEMSKHLDHVVLFSGDGDFRSMVEAVQRRGVRVTVVSTMRSQPPMAADELRRQADNFVELGDLIDDIARVYEERPIRFGQQDDGSTGEEADGESDAGDAVVTQR